MLVIDSSAAIGVVVQGAVRRIVCEPLTRRSNPASCVCHKHPAIQMLQYSSPVALVHYAQVETRISEHQGVTGTEAKIIDSMGADVGKCKLVIPAIAS